MVSPIRSSSPTVPQIPAASTRPAAIANRTPSRETAKSDAIPRRIQDAALAALVKPFDAAAQRDALWQQVLDSAYGALPRITWQYGSPTGFLKLLWKSQHSTDFQRDELLVTFADTGDVRPWRQKTFHPYGVVAKATFVPETGSTFTGLLAQETPVLLRSSLAGDESTYAPGLALKFFVDGGSTRNVLAVPSLDAQKSRDFFAGSPTTSIGTASYPARLLQKALERLLPGANKLPVDALAAVDSKGKGIRSASVVAPDALTFKSPGRHFAPDTKQDFRAELMTSLRAGDVLYEVWATPKDGSEEVKIGVLRLDSGFVASDFGDHQLHFNHPYSRG